MNAKENLKTWLLTKKYVRTSEIIRWGCNGGFSNRADRNARQLREEGFLRRLSSDEIKALGIETNEGIYEVMGESKHLVAEPNGQYNFCQCQ